ncbi:MAG: restriction endonuclease [Anaerolineales bacterium]
MENPIRERVGEGIFTDREEELAFLMDWAAVVARKQEKSIALVSPRRRGKTAILEHFYNRIFWERDDVVPFYYELKEGEQWIIKFASEYYLAFLRQFLAYRLRDASISFNKELDLYSLAVEAGEESIQRSLKNLPRLQKAGHFNLMQMVRELPHLYASRTGLSVIVIFDEFQRLDEVLYYDEELTRKCHPHTGSFSSVVESTWAPMLIAGSQVTMLSRRALGGAMAGRVGRVYLETLPLDGGAELARKLARSQGFEMPLEMAYTLSRLTDGHPYYIWCLFHSRKRTRDLLTESGLQETLTFEVENPLGRINEFWRDHFLRNMAAINEVNAKKMVLFLTRGSEKARSTREIVEALNLSISTDEADERLRALVWGDIIEQAVSYGYYHGLKDAMLARVLLALYGPEMEERSMEEVLTQVEDEIVRDMLAAKDEMIASLRGQLNNWVGRAAEAFIEKVLKRCFEDQEVDGETYFHRPGPVRLSRMARVQTTYAQPPGATRDYQVDLYAEAQSSDALPWVVEVKNWQSPVTKPVVAHFLEAAAHLRAERGHTVSVCWFHARGGFTSPAETLLRAQGVLYTGQESLIQLLQDLHVLDKW